MRVSGRGNILWCRIIWPTSKVNGRWHVREEIKDGRSDRADRCQILKIRVDSIEWKQVLLKEDIFGKEKFLFEAKEDITFGAKFEA